MSGASSSSVSCALADGGFSPKLTQHHRPVRSQLSLSSSFFGADACDGGLLQLRPCSSLRMPTHFSFSSFICEFSCHRALLRNRSCGNHHHGVYFQKVTSLSPSSSVGACVCNDSPLQFEHQQLCLTSLSPFPSFGSPEFGGISQHRLTCVLAHSKQHLSLQEDQERLIRIQQRREALRKHQEAILDSITQHQASLKQSSLLSTNSQAEGVRVGYVPAGFDASSCRSVFVGNVHRKVSEKFLFEVFSTVGSLAACRLIRKEKSSYGFVEYQDHRAAAMAISTLNGRRLFKLPIKVNWAFLGEEREDLTEYHKIFVGGLSSYFTDTELFKLFSTYPSCVDAFVQWDFQTGRSKGFGFVTFKEREDAVKAIEEMTGKMLGDKVISCGWAVKKDSVSGGPLGQDAVKVANKQGGKNNPLYTTVYVGNLARKVTRDELQEFFDSLGAGDIEDVYLSKSRDYGFVRYSTHAAAALAIKAADGKTVGEMPVKCSWGTKPNALLGVSGSQPLALSGNQPSESSPSMDQSSESSPSPSSMQPAEELTLVEG